MKKTFVIAHLTFILIGFCASYASASSFSGQVQTLRFGECLVASQNCIRVAAYVGITTSCSYPSWYAYEYTDGPGKAFTAALLTAQAAGKSVVIFGKGTCDSYGIEQVSYVDVVP